MSTDRQQMIREQILVLSEDERESLYRFMQDLRQRKSDRSDRLSKLKTLFEETQSLPQVEALSEHDILLEIETYRQGK